MVVSFVSLFFLNVQILAGFVQYLPMPVQLAHDLYVIRHYWLAR